MDALHTHVRGLDSSGIASVDVLFEQLEQQLLNDVGYLSLPTLILEFRVAQLRDELPSNLADRWPAFVDRLAEQGRWQAFWSEYPVLARQIIERASLWVSAARRCLESFAQDRERLANSELIAGDDLLESVGPAMGDYHCGLQTVRTFSFQSGKRVVFKPRSLAIDAWFQRFVGALNDLGLWPSLPVLQVLQCDGRGWEPYIAHSHCQNDDELSRFYCRHGSYLAILHVLGATDFHYENLIASGELPYLIDLETLFQPSRSEHSYQSVLSTGLLPVRWLGSGGGAERGDLSGLGAQNGEDVFVQIPQVLDWGSEHVRIGRADVKLSGSANAPTNNNRRALDSNLASLLKGFSTAYDLLAVHKDLFTKPGGMLWDAESCQTRVILRGSETYARILQNLRHPNSLRDGIDRDIAVDDVWADVALQPKLENVIASEQWDLLRGDIPIFRSAPGVKAISDSRGNECDTAIAARSGLECVLRRCEDLGQPDKRKQLWLIQTALASSGLTSRHSVVAENGLPLGAGRSSNSEGAARELANRAGEIILALGRGGASDQDWLTLTFENDQWRMHPIGHGLYDGLVGIGVFLAYLAKDSGNPQVVRRAIAVAEGLCAMSYETALGSGVGLSGAGGLAYGLLHMGEALGFEPANQYAIEILRRCRTVLRNGTTEDLIGGSAGLILATRAAADPAEASLVETVTAAAHALANHAEGALAGTDSRGKLWTGFAHGAAGMACALSYASSLTGQRRFMDVANRLFSYERAVYSEDDGNWPDFRDPSRTDFMVAWCHGATGIGISRLLARGWLPDPELDRELRIAVDSTIREGTGTSHCFCHGDLGNLDFLLEAAHTLRDDRLLSVAHGFARSICRSVERDGFRCGLGNLASNVPIPGLFTGIAGIGLGLLRAADPSSVPAISALRGPLR